MDREAWVCVECTFQCRSCAFRVPINGVTDVATCAHCGIEQALDVQQWRELLDEAHDAADRWTGDNGGDKHRGLQVAGDNELHAKAKAGHPPCAACQAPLDVKIDADARAVASCACGATATFELSATARRISAAKAILSSEHRSDRAHVHVDGEQAVAIKCPQCAAPLPIDQATKFVTCTYCRTQSRIPDRTWFRMASTVPDPEAMWLLFEGPSKKHEGAEKQRRQAKLADAKRKAAAREAQRDRQDADDRARAAGEVQRADAHERTADLEELAKADTKRFRVMAALFVVLMLTIGIIIAVVSRRSAPSTSARASTTKNTTAPANDYASRIQRYEASCSRAIYPPSDSIAGTPQGDAYQACVDAAKLVASADVPIDLRLAHVARVCRADACTEYQVVSIGTTDKERRAIITPWRALCTSGMTDACTFLANACRAGGVQEACTTSVSTMSSSAPTSSSASPKRPR